MSAFPTLCFVLSAMNGKIKQCIYIRFCVKLGKSTAKTREMLCEAFGEHSLRRTAVFEWHLHFKAGQVSVVKESCIASWGMTHMDLFMVSGWACLLN
jgi:hypothetical protein